MRKCQITMSGISVFLIYSSSSGLRWQKESIIQLFVREYVGTIKYTVQDSEHISVTFAMGLNLELGLLMESGFYSHSEHKIWAAPVM